MALARATCVPLTPTSNASVGLRQSGIVWCSTTANICIRATLPHPIGYARIRELDV